MSAPAGGMKGANRNRDLMAWENDIDEQPLAITNGETDGEPSNVALLPPSGLSNAMKRVRGQTAGAKRGRNTASIR